LPTASEKYYVPWVNYPSSRRHTKLEWNNTFSTAKTPNQPHASMEPEG
jgi:hypothetical protein